MDDRLRRLERSAASGDPEAVRALDQERLRAGLYSIRELELAVWLGRADLVTRFGLDPALETGARYMAFTQARTERIYDTIETAPQSGIGGSLTIQGGQASGSGVGGNLVIMGGGGSEMSPRSLMEMNDWFFGLLRFGTDAYYRAMLSLGELGYQALCDRPLEGSWITSTGPRSLPDDRHLCRQVLDTAKKWIEAGQPPELARACGQIIASWPTDMPFRLQRATERRDWWVELGRSVFTGINSTAYTGVVLPLLGHGIVQTPTALRRISGDLMPARTPSRIASFASPP